jgi:hypothetical protein
MCKVLEVSRSSYYKKKNRSNGKRANESKQLVKMIREVFDESKQRYGSPRITAETRNKL